MIRKMTLMAGLLLATHLPPAFAAQASPDTVFKALEDELTRSMTLRLNGLDAPYFIQYEVSDSTTYHIAATDGALLRSSRDQSRTLVSQLRVGSEVLDNSNFGGRGGSGLGVSASLPTDDNETAIRQAVWRATDAQFKDALEALTRKRAYLKDRTIEDRPADFSKAAPLVSVKEPAHLSVDRAAWEDRLRRISAQCRAFSRIQNADVEFIAGLANRYLLNSEGSRVRDGQTETLLRITLEAQAEDGQWISDHLSYFAPTPEELPPMDQVRSELAQTAYRLEQAVAAPVLEDYSGPVLFEGLAATQLFRQLLGSGLTATPDSIGTGRRSAQNSDDLDSRVGKRLLPPVFQIYDDPRPTKFKDSFLAGHYLVDDEAVPAQRVDLVVDGKLDGLLSSRTPSKHFAQSNGHGRRGGGDVARSALGCVYVEAKKTYTPEDLKKELLAAADREGLKFGLRVGGLQSRSGAIRFRRGGGAGRAIGDPIFIFKVYVADGHEEPVRGCEFNSLELQSLRRILAAGNTPTVQNNVIGLTPSSSIIAPPVLLEEVELSRIRAEGERKPILDSPLARKP